MNATRLFVYCCLLLCFLYSAKARGKGKTSKDIFQNGGEDAGEKKRNGKVFSLFNIVTFKNLPCSSNSVISSASSRRNGTCYTSTECSSKSGTASGNCAAGFGVCCLFLVTGTTATISQNCTYLQNPGFPSTYADTTSVTYTINKCTTDVCFIRLDFESFTIRGMTVSTEVGACTDTFVASVNTNQVIPTICGQNTGQHIYLDIGTQSSDNAMLTFTFSGSSSTRQWEIKATQVECTALENRPPEGCFQFHTGLTGRITTFNFIPTSGESHLPNQEYSTCIRQEEGYCCVEYTVCSDANSFSIDNSLRNTNTADAANTLARNDQACENEYIIISASDATCSQTTNGLQGRNRFCAFHFNTAALAADIPVCDCTAPFFVHVHTDAVSDIAANAVNTKYSRGVCLEYHQIPCD